MPPGGEKEAVRFYEEVLGLTHVPKPEQLAGRGGAWFRSSRHADGSGAVEVHMGVDHDFHPARKAHPAFLVRDLDAVRGRLEAAGADVRSDEALPGVERFHTSDPFGNRLEFQQEVRP